MLTARLVKFRDRELNPIFPEARLVKKRLIPGWLATAIPCRSAAAARRRLAGGQRGGFVPGMTLFSTETLRASRTFRAEATASFRRPSRPAEGKAPVA